MKKPKRPPRKRPRQLSDQSSVQFLCPVCWQSLHLPVDRSGGAHQQFIYDCEICCRPLVVEIDCSEEPIASVRAE